MRVVGQEAGRHDDQVGIDRIEGGRHLVGRGELDQLDPDDGQDARTIVVGPMSRDMHPAAELGERVGDREARDAETEHEHAQARPVVVPARQFVGTRRHYWLTHSR